MKKLIAVVLFSIFIAIVLISLAFFYIDLSGHKHFEYEAFIGGEPYGSVQVDRYVTEDKIVYKSISSYSSSDQYPEVTAKLLLKKRTMTTLKYIEEAAGSKGQKRLTLLIQRGEKSDFLFLEFPRFITLKSFETGKKTMVFSPFNVMLYMSIMDKYNFWKKGAQFFEVMIPVNEPVPPMRDKIEIRHIKDEYITVMGRRNESDSFSITAEGFPKAIVYVSKNSHRILAVNIEDNDIRIILSGYEEGSANKIKGLVEKIRTQIARLKEKDVISGENDRSAKEQFFGNDHTETNAPYLKSDTVGEDVFFESEDLVLAGKIWIPGDKGLFPAVVFVQEDAPVNNGEQYLMDSLGKALSGSGIVFFSFDYPGHGKSQGAMSRLDDEKKTKSVVSAVDYLKGIKNVKKDSISLLGYNSGGYIAVKAAERRDTIRSCILLGAPLTFERALFLKEDPKKYMQRILDEFSLGPFDETFMETAIMMTGEHLEKISDSDDNFSFFMGLKVPLKEYRDYVARKPYDAMLNAKDPILLVLGKDDKYFDPQLINEFKRSLKKTNDLNKIAVLGNPGKYMGEIVLVDGKSQFFLTNDVLDLIKNWIYEK